MQLQTIEMPVNEARKAFNEYRQAVKERHNAEDAELLRGYRELVRGHRLIALSAVMKDGGLDHHWHPRLAAIRADFKECWLRMTQEGGVTFTPRSDIGRRTSDTMRFPDGTFPHNPNWNWSDNAYYQLQWRALVPSIPPRLRPRTHLRNYHILWEAEWAKARPPAPKDPALLKHIGGDLYAVVATWDMTELERTVLQGRRR